MKILRDSLMVFIFLLWGCSQNAVKKFQGTPIKKSSSKARFEFADKNGTYLFEREAGYLKGKNVFYTKQQMIAADDSTKVLEESESYSKLGVIKKKLRVLRPSRSVYSVWFDKKKYSSTLALLPKDRAFRLKLESPEEQWNGVKKVSFPKNATVVCFFSQMIECVNTTNFINMATEKEAGQMNLHVVWDGFPYMQQQYEGLPDELFTQAIFEYDGRNEKNERRFTLRFAGQSIFYFVDNDNNFYKMFWVAQGISLVRSDAVTAGDQGEFEE